MLLITGANGFIGAHLTSRLARQSLPFRLASRSTAPGVVAVGDINAATDWSTAVAGVSTVVHLAGIAHQLSRRPDLEEFRSVNVAGSLNLARQAALAGAKRFVFMSSIGVLGQTTISGQQLSDQSRAAPVTPYAVSKHEAEVALQRLCQELELELVIIRPPLVYGRNAKGNFARLVNLVSSGYPLPLRSIDNRRSMVSVESLADAIIACASKPEAANETFVVADRQSVSTPDVVRAIAKGLGTDPRLLPFPPGILATALRVAGRSTMAEGLLSSLEVDSSRIAKQLDWTPEQNTLEAIEAQLTTTTTLHAVAG
ncbi:NAD-dependent epimerase/dehydratase family protein [Rhizobium sp. AG855]|uniref:NAD-dependent epimerase/dehydratase family protein n=1 Tax=Rhizobium sp. AG855 TaxID=2183898 RepID=UPI000E754F28|nr:NAD-dependent epimerase/dehydratase family protein [Rhizobium sp. AG855]RKE85539.1 nucleoside-diphosphate-sugar epimerase [Rhizobium sp. AG855]